MKIRTVLIAGAMLASSGVSAATWYVDDKNGSDSNDGSENAPFKTIQKALDLGIDTLKDGEIVVRKGIYKLGGNPIHGNLYCKLRSETDDPADVVVDAENLSECARFAGMDKKPPFIVSGFTFINGNKPTQDSATYCALSVVKNVVVSNCVVASCGSENESLPPVYVGTAQMIYCTISNCVSKGNGTAIRLGPDGIFEKGLITGCLAPTGVHGPIYAYNGGIVRDSMVSNNTSKLCPGLYGAPQEVSGCHFVDNSVTMDAFRDSGTLVICRSTDSSTVPDLCVISNCVISGTVYSNPNYVTCAGIRIDGISSLVVGCTVSNNISRRYTGLYVKSVDATKNIEIVDCVFSDNKATSGDGGGAYLGNGVKVRGCTFSGNTASVAGGGVYGLGFEMDGCVISNNTAKCGGGICVVTNGVAAAAISNSVFRLNSSTHEGGALSVGYLYKTECAYTNGHASVYLSLFEGNSTDGGEGTSWPGGGAVSILREGRSSALIEGCVFKLNTSKQYGGAVSCRGVNTADYSGAPIDIRSSLFIGNTSTKNGGAIYAISKGPLYIDNCTFVDNASSAQNGGNDTYIRWSGVEIRNCIYAQTPTDSDTINRSAVKNCLINAEWLPTSIDKDAGKTDSEGNIAADPGFADAANGDYSLKRDSVCIGRGVMRKWMERRSKDAAGSRRVCGSLPDLGAFEYYFPVGLKLSVR